DPFMMMERPWLMEHFESVRVVSFYGVKTTQAKDGETFSPFRPGLAALRAWLTAVFSRDLRKELARLFRDHRATPTNVLKLMMFTQRGLKMHYWTEWLLRGCDDRRVTLYACWMSFDGYAAALSKRKHPKARFVVRGHAFDVDEERNPMNPYLMKQAIADAADGIYPISEITRSQYMAYMRGHVAELKVRVLAMGSGGAPMAACKEPPRFSQNVLRVVSCSQLIDIKQVPLIVEALAGWTGCSLCWTHIGGGEGEAALRKLAAQKLDAKENVIYDITGKKSADEVRKYYEDRAFDVFVNVSRKEGVPVSIMEAMRCGVPAIAPAVGGIPELVTPGTGILYAPERGADGLREALEQLCSMSLAQTREMRENAKLRWERSCASRALLPKLFPEAKG
ncbi:MAG: glycosyltransferase, partial [Clostridia bacterium]